MVARSEPLGRGLRSCAQALGKKRGEVTCEPVPAGAFCSALEGAGVPAWLARGITCTHTDFWAKGSLDYASSAAVCL